MNSGIWPWGRWGSEKRCEQAVRRAQGLLGLDYGEGHLEGLYRAAYADGLRDGYEQMRVIAAQAAKGVAGGWLDWGEPPEGRDRPGRKWWPLEKG